MKTDRQLRQEIANNRKLLRERKRKNLGLPASKPTTHWKDGHEYLAGMREHLRRRIEIFTNAGGEVMVIDHGRGEIFVEELTPAACQGCTETHLVGWEDGEWHHNVKSNGGKRCDCAACGLYVCKRWHVAFHNRVIAVRQIQG